MGSKLKTEVAIETTVEVSNFKARIRDGKVVEIDCILEEECSPQGIRAYIEFLQTILEGMGDD